MKILVAASIIGFVCPSSVLADGDVAQGRQLFGRCSACHAIDGQSKSGPALDGAYGRKAGSARGYRYSAALTNSTVVWNDETLEVFLSGPTKMVRGVRMTTAVPKEGDRADIIAYLKSLTVP